MVKQTLIALDQLINTFIKGGYADETISARCYRQRNDPAWGIWVGRIDWIFLVMLNEYSHCFQSYLNEKQRSQLPEEYRAATENADINNK